MPDAPQSPSSAGGRDLLSVLLLVVLIAALAGGYWLFPRFQNYMNNQDCVAAGRTNC